MTAAMGNYIIRRQGQLVGRHDTFEDAKNNALKGVHIFIVKRTCGDFGCIREYELNQKGMIIC